MILFPLSAILLITTSSDSVIVPTTLVPSEYLKPVNAILELSEFAERLCISTAVFTTNYSSIFYKQ